MQVKEGWGRGGGERGETRQKFKNRCDDVEMRNWKKSSRGTSQKKGQRKESHKCNLERMKAEEKKEESKNLRGCDGAEPLLAGCIPNLQFDPFSINF